MKRVAVFCGSNAGNHPEFKEQAVELGTLLANEGIELVYGGAKVGIMGIIADAVLENGGNVIGVIPNFLRAKEIAHTSLTQLIIVETMHERKMKMNELSDGVIALPGGFGTLEELFEILTWSQLGLHTKPSAILNTNGFYNPLHLQIQTMVENGFLKEETSRMLLFCNKIGEIIPAMRTYVAPVSGKWIKKSEL